MENEALIRKFYEAFARADAAAMTDCYADDVTFSDPAFGVLHGADAKNMWKMLVEKSGGTLKINFDNVQADGAQGSADWVAEYVFSQTKRPVVNRIHAEFEFKDGKIFRHADDFDFWNWSKQALGIPGLLFGWSTFMQTEIRRNAVAALSEFSRKQRQKND